MALAASRAAVVSACVGRLSQLRLLFSIPSSQQLLQFFPRLDHIRRSHFMLYFSIFFPADSSIKTRSDSFMFWPFLRGERVPAGSLFSCLMCKTISLSIPIPENMLKQVQMVSHRTNVCPENAASFALPP